MVQLRQHLAGPLDRTGHQLRKKDDEGGERPPMPFRLRLPTIHVECVTHRLECVKRQANREDNGQIGKKIIPLPTVQGVGHERVILENKQDSEIRRHADEQDRSPRTGPCRPRQCQADDKINRRDHNEKDRVRRPPAHVEVIAGDQKQNPAQPLRRPPEEGDDDRKEDGELEQIETHSSP